MNNFLLIMVIILTCLILGLIIFLWWQFNHTESRLSKIIKDKIQTNNAFYHSDEFDDEFEK